MNTPKKKLRTAVLTALPPVVYALLSAGLIAQLLHYSPWDILGPFRLFDNFGLIPGFGVLLSLFGLAFTYGPVSKGRISPIVLLLLGCVPWCAGIVTEVCFFADQMPETASRLMDDGNPVTDAVFFSVIVNNATTLGRLYSGIFLSGIGIYLGLLLRRELRSSGQGRQRPLAAVWILPLLGLTAFTVVSNPGLHDIPLVFSTSGILIVMFLGTPLIGLGALSGRIGTLALSSAAAVGFAFIALQLAVNKLSIFDFFYTFSLQDQEAIFRHGAGLARAHSAEMLLWPAGLWPLGLFVFTALKRIPRRIPRSVLIATGILGCIFFAAEQYATARDTAWLRHMSSHPWSQASSFQPIKFEQTSMSSTLIRPLKEFSKQAEEERSLLYLHAGGAPWPHALITEEDFIPCTGSHPTILKPAKSSSRRDMERYFKSLDKTYPPSAWLPPEAAYTPYERLLDEMPQDWADPRITPKLFLAVDRRISPGRLRDILTAAANVETGRVTLVGESDVVPPDSKFDEALLDDSLPLLLFFQTRPVRRGLTVLLESDRMDRLADADPILFHADFNSGNSVTIKTRKGCKIDPFVISLDRKQPFKETAEHKHDEALGGKAVFTRIGNDVDLESLIHLTQRLGDIGLRLCIVFDNIPGNPAREGPVPSQEEQLRKLKEKPL